jgi:hypothetical protein
LPHPHHPPLGRAGDRQVKPAGKSTLAGNRKIGDKFRIRAFTGPETGMACLRGARVDRETRGPPEPPRRRSDCFFSPSERPMTCGMPANRAT